MIEFVFNVTSLLVKKLFLPELLDGILYELDIQDPQKKWLLNLPKGETDLQDSHFLKESVKHSVWVGFEDSYAQAMPVIKAENPQLLLHHHICLYTTMCNRNENRLKLLAVSHSN